MFRYEILQAGDLFGQTIEFPHTGDGIPMHEHPEKEQHITLVLAGSCLIYGPLGPDHDWRVQLNVGEIYDFPTDRQRHEIVALEPGTRLLSLNKFGRPDGPLPDPDEMRGEVRKPPEFRRGGE